MANHKSSEKRARQTRIKTERNRFYKTRIKNVTKNVLAAIESADKEKAVEAKLISADEPVDVHKIAECLFSSGVSTAEKVTAISGRGVGMDAVRKFLRQYGAEIRVQFNSDVDKSPEFLPFKLVIELPSAMVVKFSLA